MNPFLCCLWFLLAQPAEELRFRKVEPNNIEVVAKLSEAQQAKIPAGRLLADKGEEWLRLCVLDPQTGKPGPAMFGAYERRGPDLVFRPRFALEAGRTYRAYFGPPTGATITADYRPALPKETIAPKVVKILPTANVLPANQLRFYVYFSQPLRGGKEIFEHIDILDADGKKVVDPWLYEELWDEDDQCLILYIHPGRIKWSVLLRELLGPVLMPDREYALVVRGELLGANGRKLGADFTKKFRTSAEQRTRIVLADWKIQPPPPASRQPVVVHFPRAIDHKGLGRFLTVTEDKGQPVTGTIAIGPEEKTWSFTPARDWADGDYHLRVDGRLEDVAGNTPLRPFDLDLKAPPLPPQLLQLTFRPKSAGKR